MALWWPFDYWDAGIHLSRLDWGIVRMYKYSKMSLSYVHCIQGCLKVRLLLIKVKVMTFMTFMNDFLTFLTFMTFIRLHGVRCRGAGGRPPPPRFWRTIFQYILTPQILAGFVVKCFNSIIKFLELREWESIVEKKFKFSLNFSKFLLKFS